MSKNYHVGTSAVLKKIVSQFLSSPGRLYNAKSLYLEQKDWWDKNIETGTPVSTINSYLSESISTNKPFEKITKGIYGLKREWVIDNANFFDNEIIASYLFGNIDSASMLNESLDAINDEIIFAEDKSEGGKKRVYINVSKRSALNRIKSLAIHGFNCYCCGFNFEKFYGKIGEGFIEVHHRVMLGNFNESKKVNVKDDLINLCSNCHRMVHRNGKLINVEELKLIIKNAQQGDAPESGSSE